MHTFAQKPKAPQQATPAKPTILGRAHFGHSQEVNSIFLQRMLGNQAVQRLVQANTEELTTGSATTASTRVAHDFSRIPIHSSAPGGIQPKLMVNTPGDVYEQEADRMADQVMRMPEPQLQRACACSGTCPKCQTEGHERLQTNHVGTGDLGQTAAPPIVHEVMRSPGQPLDPATRDFMEPRFGYDFSRVRMHSGTAAEQSARDVNAHAYTVGHGMVFGAGRFAPGTHEGRWLIAHELAHVVQQQALPSSSAVVQRQPDPMQQHVDDMDMEMERKYANSGAPKAQTCGRPSWCPVGFCSPYNSEKLAEYYRAKRGPLLLAGIATVVNSRVVPFWQEYLSGGSPPKDITGDFSKDFTNSPTTLKATTFLTNELKKSLAAKPPVVTASTSMDIAPLIPAAIAALNDSASTDRMNFSVPRDIPGNLAGDIGTNQTACPAGAQPSPFSDERKVAGVIKVTPKSGSQLEVSPSFTFTVKDTVDLCPGDCGSRLEQIATVPLSQFEATGISGDVPFTVRFPAPALGSFTISAPATTSPAPAPAPAPAPVPMKPPI